MKKILAILLSLCLCITMISSVMLITSADTAVTTTVMDLTKVADMQNIGGTTGSSCTATVEGSVVKVHVENYERQCSTCTPSASTTWLPNFIARKADGTIFSFKVGNKAIVEVTYKVTGDPNANHGTQICIGAKGNGNNNQINTKVYRKHVAADKGKTFTLSACYDVTSDTLSPKIAFSGGGEIEISAIKLTELKSSDFEDYCTATLKTSTDDSFPGYVFCKKGETMPELEKTNFIFGGYYSNSDFSEKVTTVAEDSTLYVKWIEMPKTYDIDFSKNLEDSLYGYNDNTTYNATATVNEDKLEIALNDTSHNVGNVNVVGWAPNYLLYDSGSVIQTGTGNKIAVNVTYRIIEVTSDITMAIAGADGGGSAMVTLAKQSHSSTDAGKEFTLSHSYINDGQKHPSSGNQQSLTTIKVGFRGKGTFEISKITVQILPSVAIDDYCVATYQDGNYTEKEFVLKSGNLNKTPTKENCTFLGWYDGNTKVETVSADTTVTAKWLRTYDIDLTQDPANCLYADSAKSYNATATVRGNKLAVDLTDSHTINGDNWATWAPNYGLCDETGKAIKATVGDKVMVNVAYKVISATSGLKICIGGWNSIKSSAMVVKLSKDLDSSSVGKEGTLSVSYSDARIGNNANVDIDNIKVGFTGTGTIEISKITVQILPSAAVDECCVLTSKEDYYTEKMFVKKGAELAPTREGATFDGYYTNADFSGSKVTSISTDATLYPYWIAPAKFTDVDLTQTPAMTQSGQNYTDCSATVEGDIVKVYVHNFDRHLTATDKYGTPSSDQTWYPNFAVVDNGAPYQFTIGSKAIVKVKYKVLPTPDGNYGTEIGIGTWSGATGSNMMTKVARKHVYADIGKEFTLSACFDVKNNNDKVVKIAFSGGGNLEISDILLYELPTYNKSNYTVTYDENGTFDYEFLIHGSALKKPAGKPGYNFEGWLFGGNKVTTANADGTYESVWYKRTDLNNDTVTDIKDLVNIETAISESKTETTYDIDCNGTVEEKDIMAMRHFLLKATVIDSDNISEYSIYVSNPSLILKRSAEAINSALNVSLPIVNTECEKEIALVVDDTIATDCYAVEVLGNNLVITAGSEYAASTATRKVCDYINSNGTVAADFTLDGNYDPNYSMVGNYKYAWGDEFNGSSLDTTKWMDLPEKDNDYQRTAFGGNGIIDYTSRDYTVNNGALTLNTRKTDTGFSAAKITAKTQFTYGIMETKVKFGAGNGGCYQVWTRGKDTTPKETCVVNEFDFIENFGYSYGRPNLHTWRHYTEHTDHGKTITTREDVPNINDGEYHYIAMEWNANVIRFYFDGELYLEQNIEDQSVWDAFRKSTHMVFAIDVPASGTTEYSNVPSGDLSKFSDSMTVDYVRVYQLSTGGQYISR